MYKDNIPTVNPKGVQDLQILQWQNEESFACTY